MGLSRSYTSVASRRTPRSSPASVQSDNHGIGPAFLVLLSFTLPVFALAIWRGRLHTWPANARKASAAQRSTIHRIVKTAVFVLRLEPLHLFSVHGFSIHGAEHLFRPSRIRRDAVTGCSPGPCGWPPPPGRGPCGKPVTETVGVEPPAGIRCFHTKVRRPVNGQARPADGDRHAGRAGCPQDCGAAGPGGPWPRRVRPVRTPPACGRPGRGWPPRYGG